MEARSLVMLKVMELILLTIGLVGIPVMRSTAVTCFGVLGKFRSLARTG